MDTRPAQALSGGGPGCLARLICYGVGGTTAPALAYPAVTWGLPAAWSCLRSLGIARPWIAWGVGTALAGSLLFGWWVTGRVIHEARRDDPWRWKLAVAGCLMLRGGVLGLLAAPFVILCLNGGMA